MSENEAATVAQAEKPAGKVTPEQKPESALSFGLFLVKLIAIVLVIRIFIFAPFSIPSESMLPRLINGDHLIASKWNYGYSNNSLPFNLKPFPEGRIFASQPERGDIVIFKHPLDGIDYIKRVIGLPGDQIQMRGGVLFINGEPVKKERIADFVVATSPNTSCHRTGAREQTGADGTRLCRYVQFRETLPNGVSYNVVDFGATMEDDTPIFTVPQGELFLMGDNRDNSQDSRRNAVRGGWIGMVPQDNLVGKAQFMMWSTDGGASWLLPWTWFTNTRWSRIGDAI
ncbi:MAG TPA: signal peptidase I [Sphingomonadaceae bacterium]|nr:signal peptidase I [Sphingomonadaceae bacterium]